MKISYIYNKQDKRLEEYTQFIHSNFPRLITEQDPDLFLIAGGDGSMLHAIHENIDKQKPFLGKAMGTLNFLMNNIENDKEVIQGLLDDTISLQYFDTYAIEVLLDNKKIGEAINDVIIGGNLSDYFTFNITTEHGDLENFEVKGSGLCISTAIGSTAFNFNNGGRILPLDSCLLSITGVVCNRYLNDIIPFQEIRIKSNGANIYLTNIPEYILNTDSELVLRKGSAVKLAFLNREEFIKRRIEFSHRYRK